MYKFYARLDETDYRREQEQLRDQLYKSTSDECDFKESGIRLLFRGLNRHKAYGPDGVTPAVFKMCVWKNLPKYLKFYLINLFRITVCLKCGTHL